MDKNSSSTPGWDALPKIQKEPLQTLPRSILKRGATIEDLVDQDSLVLDDEGLGLGNPSVVQAERNKILTDISIYQGEKTRNTSDIIGVIYRRDKQVWD